MEVYFSRVRHAIRLAREAVDLRAQADANPAHRHKLLINAGNRSKRAAAYLSACCKEN